MKERVGSSRWQRSELMASGSAHHPRAAVARCAGGGADTRAHARMPVRPLVLCARAPRCRARGMGFWTLRCSHRIPAAPGIEPDRPLPMRAFPPPTGVLAFQRTMAGLPALGRLAPSAATPKG
eukprot:scaffold28019_cov132-Isochrysis_galbana.AAC.1